MVNRTYQIVGVLIKFWQSSTAIMADIQAIYYHMIVPKHQQTTFKSFLECMSHFLHFICF